MAKMKAIYARDEEVIMNVLASLEDGASIEDLENAPIINIERRTLQRRLKKLFEEGRITISGNVRSTRYNLVRLAPYSLSSLGGDLMVAEESSYNPVPLSTESRKIIAEISRPVGARKRVGYNMDFLLSYRPNSDSYLSESEKRKLAELGVTARLDQPAGTYAREILNRLLIDLSWNSSRLEGNSYSLLETARLIETGEAGDSKTLVETQMILNHKDAIRFIVETEEGIGFNRYTILGLHALLSYNLLANRDGSGRLRTITVGIGKSSYTPLAVPQQVEEMFDLILEKAGQIENPFEQAFFAMVHLPYLQPFEDVNKRVSRLAANIPLNKHNYAPLAFIDVPNDSYIKGMLAIYELNRIEPFKDLFMWAYQRSAFRYAALRQTLGEPDRFLMKYSETIRTIIREILSGAYTKKDAGALIKANARRLPVPDQLRFIEAVETEIMSLHDGKYVRYWITPTEFQLWKEAWTKG